MSDPFPVFASAPTGRVLLRYPHEPDVDGNPTGEAQRGYIVPECEGTFRTREIPWNPESAVVERDYRYAPCFVADLTVTVNGPDFTIIPEQVSEETPEYARGLVQQDINVQVFGPVAFQRNGGLVISTKNANTFDVTGVMLLTNTSAFAGQKRIYPGRQNLQLVTPPVHGGPLQSFDVP